MQTEELLLKALNEDSSQSSYLLPFTQKIELWIGYVFLIGSMYKQPYRPDQQSMGEVPFIWL